jgi:acyl-CoA reductase-like NAD-dependent aldehyde dehydrogenase
MLKPAYPLYLANLAQQPNEDLAVTNKFSGEVACRVALADTALIDQAIAAAVAAEVPMRRLAAYERKAVLEHCVKRFRERRFAIEDMTVIRNLVIRNPSRAL